MKVDSFIINFDKKSQVVTIVRELQKKRINKQFWATKYKENNIKFKNPKFGIQFTEQGA